MTEPRFGEGQRVTVARAPAGVYRVVRVLPAEGRPLQYRVKGELEQFERIVAEVNMEAVGYG